MKLWIQSSLLTVLLLTYSGCTTTPKPTNDTKLDRALPTVHLTKNGVFADMNAIAFEWESLSNTQVGGVFIYKSKVEYQSNQQKLRYYKTVNNRFATHFVDNDVEPNTNYVYLFKTFKADRESIGTKVDVKSLPVLNSVTWIHSIIGLPRSAKIIWRPHTNQKVEYYLIERKMHGEDNFKEIAKVKGRLNAEYIDDDLQDNAVYYYRIKVKTFDGVVSKASKTVKIVTKKLPASVENIQATTSLAKKIVVSWSPTDVADFQYYNIYKAPQKNATFKLFKKTRSTKCVDNVDDDGKKYFYKVSVVDKDGLESLHDRKIVMGMSLAKPNKPYDVAVTLLDNAVKIVWQDDEPRVKSYIVERKENDGWFKYRVKEYKNIRQKSFVDRTIEPNKTYKYSVFAVDGNGIVSKRSKEIEVQTNNFQKKMIIENGQTIMTIAPRSLKHTVAPARVQRVEDEVVTAIDDLEVEEN